MLIASADPVTDFIIRADSLSQAGEDTLLTTYVMDRSVLVGAAVGQLLDIAFQVGEAGDKASENENVVFAGRIAEIYGKKFNSPDIFELVKVYQGWTPEQRAVRSRALMLEEKAVAARNSGELDKAAGLFHKARGLYGAINDRRSIAVNWGSLGVVSWYKGEMDSVRIFYINALEERRAIKDHILEGKTLNGLGSVNLNSGRYGEAIKFYKKAIELRRMTEDDGGLGTSLTYLGNAYFRLGRLSDARDWFEEALPVLEKSGNINQMIELLISIGGIHADMGRYKASNRSNQRVIELSASLENQSVKIPCVLNIADNMMMTSRYMEGLDKLEEARHLLEKYPDPVLTAALFRIRGLIYTEIGEMESARDNLILSLEKSKELDDPCHHIQALLNLGYLYIDMGAFETALSTAVDAERKAEEAENTSLVCESVILEAEAERLLRHYEKSLEKFQLACGLNEASDLQPRVIENKLSIAGLYAQMGKAENARKILWNTCELINESGKDNYKYAFHLALAHTYEKENPDSAVYHYEAGLRVMEETRMALGGTEVRTGFLSGEKRHFYEEIALYYASMRRKKDRENWADRAFRTIEKAKARGLLDMLESTVLSDDSHEEETVLDSLFRLDPGSLEYREESEYFKQRYSKLRNERLDRVFGPLESEKIMLGIRETQKSIPRRTALFEYMLGDTVSLLFVLDRKGYEIFEMPGRPVLEAETEKLRDAINNPGAADIALQKTAEHLYRILLKPAESRLSRVTNLVIIPDGVLFGLPFEVLLTEESGINTKWEDQPFLTRSYSTMYAPSASVYIRMIKSIGKRKFEKDILAFGDPDFSTIRSKPGNRTGRLAQLPYTKTEVLGITSDLRENRKSVFLGEEASEGVLKGMLKEETPRILHLATHGLVYPLEPSASCVVLSSGPDDKEDGKLHTLEILSLPVRAGLVVLSACDSGRGQISRGEGVVGLSRAFIASGAGGVVASLWAVPDISTSGFMKDFYEEMLGRNKQAAGALRKARLKMIENPEYSHPYYWSAFVLTGTEKTPW